MFCLNVDGGSSRMCVTKTHDTVPQYASGNIVHIEGDPRMLIPRVRLWMEALDSKQDVW